MLQIFRRGNYRELGVLVGEFEADRPPRGVGEAPSSASSIVQSTLGLVVADLTDAQRHDLKVNGGVRIESAEGAAQRAGLREGDVILSMENTEVQDSHQFDSLVAKLDKTHPVSVLVRRGEWVNYLVIRPGR
jgi:serine protease Do